MISAAERIAEHTGNTDYLDAAASTSPRAKASPGCNAGEVNGEASTHGTIADYQRGCRCEICRRANADYEHARRVRLGLVALRPGETLVEPPQRERHRSEMDGRARPASSPLTRVDRRADDECWPWLGQFNSKGYGRWYDGERKIQAHRAVYELLVGPIADGPRTRSPVLQQGVRESGSPRTGHRAREHAARRRAEGTGTCLARGGIFHRWDRLLLCGPHGEPGTRPTDAGRTRPHHPHMTTTANQASTSPRLTAADQGSLS